MRLIFGGTLSNYKNYKSLDNRFVNGGATDHKTHCLDRITVLSYGSDHFFGSAKKKKKEKKEINLTLLSIYSVKHKATFAHGIK